MVERVVLKGQNTVGLISHFENRTRPGNAAFELRAPLGMSRREAYCGIVSTNLVTTKNAGSIGHRSQLSL
jgi:hypothetical protein